ncbi:hypothetical protein EJ08DRAFT_683591 [Tothia fuscella]|uniref:Helicase C-terminal domain-containing protein n=1 Tax=Tothia fuscella TaxID=1048955 RepID=A0A9P4NFZ9_9PEZI|nr:hypothetical protein EJ08DRAFT_683591 [Tothia fuscella]
MARIEKLILYGFEPWDFVEDAKLISIIAAAQASASGYQLAFLNAMYTPLLESTIRDLLPFPETQFLCCKMDVLLGKFVHNHVVWSEDPTWEDPMSMRTRHCMLEKLLSERVSVGTTALIMHNYKEQVGGLVRVVKAASTSTRSLNVGYLDSTKDYHMRDATVNTFNNGKTNVLITTRRILSKYQFSSVPILVLLELPREPVELIGLVPWFQELSWKHNEPAQIFAFYNLHRDKRVLLSLKAVMEDEGVEVPPVFRRI